MRERTSGKCGMPHHCILQSCETSDQGSAFIKVYTVRDKEEDGFSESAGCLSGPIHPVPKGVSYKAFLPPAAASES